jgi:hypothetical protein
MRCLAIALPLVAITLVSCDKAKVAVDAARDKFRGAADPGAPRSPGGEVADDFATQIDEAAEGVRFRRDLPFPVQLEVRSVERRTFHNAKKFSSSALGRETGVFNGTHEIVSVLSREGARVVLKVEKQGMLQDLEEQESAADRLKSASTPFSDSDRPSTAGLSIDFHQTPQGWRLTDENGPVNFTRESIGRGLQPVLPELLAAKGVLPRTQWFSPSRRWNAGDQLLLEGENLKLLFPASTGGKVTLTYEVPEAQEGHPCGRFAVAGEVTLNASPNLDGNSFNGVVSIHSGKVWCSLLHPLVLREEYQTVQTLEEGKGKGPRQRLQGAIDELKVLRWTPRGDS